MNEKLGFLFGNVTGAIIMFVYMMVTYWEALNSPGW